MCACHSPFVQILFVFVPLFISSFSNKNFYLFVNYMAKMFTQQDFPPDHRMILHLLYSFFHFNSFGCCCCFFSQIAVLRYISQVKLRYAMLWMGSTGRVLLLVKFINKSGNFKARFVYNKQLTVGMTQTMVFYIYIYIYIHMHIHTHTHCELRKILLREIKLNKSLWSLEPAS